MPAVLTMVTCGIYYFYWQYVTTEELKQATGRDDLNPMMDLLLTLCCCGLWAIYVQYRNAQVVHEQFEARGQSHEDKSTFILILHALAALNGITSLIALLMLQDEFNKLADLQGGGGAFGPPAPRTF
jgi:hypothetical protein